MTDPAIHRLVTDTATDTDTASLFGNSCQTQPNSQMSKRMAVVALPAGSSPPEKSSGCLILSPSVCRMCTMDNGQWTCVSSLHASLPRDPVFGFIACCKKTLGSGGWGWCSVGEWAPQNAVAPHFGRSYRWSVVLVSTKPPSSSPVRYA